MTWRENAHKHSFDSDEVHLFGMRALRFQEDAFAHFTIDSIRVHENRGRVEEDALGRGSLIAQCAILQKDKHERSFVDRYVAEGKTQANKRRRCAPIRRSTLTGSVEFVGVSVIPFARLGSFDYFDAIVREHFHLHPAVAAANVDHVPVGEPAGFASVEADAGGELNVIVQKHAVKPVGAPVELPDLLATGDVHVALLDDPIDCVRVGCSVQLIIAHGLSELRHGDSVGEAHARLVSAADEIGRRCLRANDNKTHNSGSEASDRTPAHRADSINCSSSVGGSATCG